MKPKLRGTLPTVIGSAAHMIGMRVHELTTIAAMSQETVEIFGPL